MQNKNQTSKQSGARRKWRIVGHIGPELMTCLGDAKYHEDMQVYWAMRRERIEEIQRILGSFLFENKDSSAMIVVPYRRASAADDVQEKNTE
jgi:hypothetical protein